jgi:hypothetical protein
MQGFGGANSEHRKDRTRRDREARIRLSRPCLSRHIWLLQGVRVLQRFNPPATVAQRVSSESRFTELLRP